MDRRTFVKIGFAAAAVTGSGVALSTPMAPTAVFFDPRYSDSRRFAQTFGELGSRTFSTASDIVQQWHANAAALSRTRLTGLTTHSDYLVLAHCADEARLRVHFEAMHDCRVSTTLTHTINQDGIDAAHALRASGTEWPATLVHALAHSPALELAAPRTSLRLRTSTAPAADHPGTLVSWLIA